MLDFVVFCREVSKSTGEVIVYEVPMENVDGHTLGVLSLRSTYNPELTYGVCTRDVWDNEKCSMEDVELLYILYENNEVVLL